MKAKLKLAEYCCTGACDQGRLCPLYAPDSERSETLPIPLGVPTGEHRRAPWFVRLLTWWVMR